MSELAVITSDGSAGADGWVKHEEGAAIWLNYREGAGSGVNTSSSEIQMVKWVRGSLTSTMTAMYRTIFSFGTSGIGAGSTVDSAVLKITTSTAGQNAIGTSIGINVYGARTGITTSIVAGDYEEDNWTGVENGAKTEYSTEVLFAAWDASEHEHTFTLIDVDTDDFGYISRTGNTVLGMMESNYDAPDGVPTPWAGGSNGSRDEMAGFMTEATDKEPTLIVQYTAAGGGWGGTINGVSNIGTVNGVAVADIGSINGVAA